MSNVKEQTSPNQKNKALEGLPLETNPYLKYKDLEDYKKKAYGTKRHLDVKENQAASGSTDSPTLFEAVIFDANTNASTK
ncbi:hypothetical protein REPUB_Repub18cG0035000 [Reevesia pubescens]